MYEDIGARTKSSLIWNTFLPATFQIYRFAIAIIIARILEPRDFGIMGIAGIIIFYTNSLSDSGFNVALIQKKEISEKHFHSFFVFNLCISIFLIGGTCLLSKMVSDLFDMVELKNVLRILSILFLITSFGVIPETFLRRELKFKKLSFIELCKGLTQTLTALTLALIGYGYWALVYGLVLGAAVKAFLLLFTVRWLPKLQYTHRCIKELFRFSLWNFVLAQVNLIGNQFDKIILGKALGATALGYYDKAFSFAMIPVDVFSNKIGLVMFSSFSRNQGYQQELVVHYAKVITAISLICFPIFCGLAIIAPWFVFVLLGEKWAPMVTPLTILSIAFIFQGLANIIGPFNIVSGDYQKHIKVKIFCVSLMLIFCLIFANLGIEAFALVILMYWLVFFIIACRHSLNILGKSWFWFGKLVMPAFLGSSVMGTLVFLLGKYIFGALIFKNFIILCIIGCAIYITFLCICNFKETRFIFQELRSRILRLKNVISKLIRRKDTI